ncbi:MAG: FixH family protein [Myxococcota bacterium]
MFKDGRYWPFLLTALLVGGVGMNIAMVLRAADDPSFAVEEDYYKRAVEWDQHRAAVRESKALGWSIRIDPRLERSGPSHHIVLDADIVDRFGRPVSDATVQVKAVHLARAAYPLHATMDRKRDRFSAVLNSNRAGQWEFSFVVERGDERFEDQKRAELRMEGASE